MKRDSSVRYTVLSDISIDDSAFGQVRNKRARLLSSGDGQWRN